MIHLIFKTHLDVGFTDFARNVVSSYFDRYIPQALALARSLREEGDRDRFIWTTGSWLIYEYLERTHGPQRQEMEAAITAGDIAWHGLPFTVHSELLDADLFRFGLSMSQELDRRFGRRTIAAKMTDVPGHTRAIVPLLAEAGIRFLHIGVNPASTPPRVPPVFRWRDPSGAEVMVMYQRGAYGDLMTVPRLGDAIAFAHTGDNQGPQSADQIRAAHAELRARFPTAVVAASTLDAFAAALEQVRETLPVITGELGDTWIHGVGSDPAKVARYRELLRLRRRWLAEGRVKANDAAFRAFSRSLLMVPEHTWGLDVKTHLDDWTNYGREPFDAARQRPNFQKMETSWAEQRVYVSDAVAALGAVAALDATALRAEAEAALAALVPSRPDLAGFVLIADPAQTFDIAHFRVAFDVRGALTRLRERSSRLEWASTEHPLGLLCYELFSQSDYDRFYRQYVINKRQTAGWSIPDFTKPGIAGVGAVHGEWLPELAALYHRREAQADRFVLRLAMPEEPQRAYGCPQEATVEYVFPDAEPVVRLDLQWFGKPACRLPEALWVSFCPRVRDATKWQLEKLGQLISPLDVVPDGNRHLHAIGEGVSQRLAPHASRFKSSRRTPGERVSLVSYDAPLVAPGQRSLLDFTNRRPPLSQGMHFLLYDNLWGTSFGMWYDEDARFRFALRFDTSR